jgi:hypothetical protein
MKNKINYINEVNEKFRDAKNHGNGGNWWYPKQNVIAYNVKIYASPDAEEIRKAMTKRQKEYYTDENIYEILQDYQDQEAEQLANEVMEYDLVEDAYFAGRSGGWLEVEYSNGLEQIEDNGIDYHKDDIKEYYKQAKELEKIEGEVKTMIENTKKEYIKYITSKQFIECIVSEMLLDDEAIGDIYKQKAKTLLDKLQ